MADKRAISYLIVPVKAGIAEGICTANIGLTITVMDFSEASANVPPVCEITSPSGVGDVTPGATYAGTVTDTDGNIDPLTIHMWLEDALLNVTEIIVDGVFQTPTYNGTIDDADLSAVTIDVSTVANLADGNYTLYLYAEDASAESDQTSVAFTVVDPGPAAEDVSPPFGGTINTSDPTLVFQLCGADTWPVDSTTIYLRITSPSAVETVLVTSGEIEAGVLGTILANLCNGFTVTITDTGEEWVPGTWGVYLYAEDTYGTPLELDGEIEVTLALGRGSPRGNTCIYPITRELAAVGLVWRDEFYSSALVQRNQGLLVNSPAFAHTSRGGLVLDGVDQAVSYDKRSGPIAAFNSSTQFWVAKVIPEFTLGDQHSYTIFDADQSGGTTNRLRITSTGALEIVVGGTTITLSKTEFEDVWNDGAENVIVVSLTDGDNYIWINNELVLDGDGTAWDVLGADGLFVGANNSLDDEFWDGTILSLRFGIKTLAAYDLSMVTS